jgi:thymidylate kinase
VPRDSAVTTQLEPVPTRAFSPLPSVTELCRRLTAAELPYCHWKSNEHLRPATIGETDLDLLVARDSALLLEPILAETGYKRMTAPPARSYTGIEDYVAMDRASGKLIHLHLHYRLVVGEKFLKGYRLPWEDRLLSTRRLDPEAGIYVTAPELELIVLVVRAALKLRRRDALGLDGSGPLDGDFLREFRWLVKRVDAARLLTEATELLGTPAAALLERMVSHGIDSAVLRRFRAATREVTDSYRTYPAAEATRRRWSREWQARWAGFRSRRLGRRQIVRFSNPRGGVIIAFLGADGSGKSTITSAVASWLSWRMEVVPLYFGFGDGPVSPLRRPLQALKLLYSRRASENKTRGQGNPTQGPTTWRGAPKAIWRVIWSWSIVREKEARLRQAQQARNLGLIAICDRYPQAQIMAIGDGPLLSHWIRHRWDWLRAAARWELAAYRRMEAFIPDLVIKLQVSPEVSAARKQDVSLESLARRAEVVNRVSFANEARVASVDADQPLEQVLLEVKRMVWEAL